MIAVGTIWSAVGGVWLYYLGPTYLFQEGASMVVFAIPTALLFGGLILLKNGVWPTRAKSFEEEKPDAHPYMGDNDWLTTAGDDDW